MLSYRFVFIGNWGAVRFAGRRGGMGASACARKGKLSIMANMGKTFKLKAEERDAYSFEYTVGRHRLLMSRTMKSDSLPVVGFCPVDLLLAGIAGCLGMTIRATMEEKGLTYEDLRIEVEGIREPDAKISALNRVKTKVFIRTDAPLDQVRAVVEESEADCTVRSTIDHAPAFETEVVLEK